MKNSKVYNPAIRDAFYKAENGKTVIAEAKRFVWKQKVIKRKEQLEQLVYMTFCDPRFVAKHNIRWDVYNQAKDVVWDMAKKSDDEIRAFEHAIKCTYINREAYEATIQLLASKS